MNIAAIHNLDDGMSNITCSGTVTFTKAAVNKTGEYNGRPYDFWSQFVVVKDSTGDIGINLNLGNDGVSAAKGQRIAVEKGTVQSYTDDKGKLRKSLRAHLATTGLPEGQQGVQQADQGTKAPQAEGFPEEKTTRSSIERQTAWRGACDWAARRPAGKETSINEVAMCAWVAAYFISTGRLPSEKHQEEAWEQEATTGMAEELGQLVNRPIEPSELAYQQTGRASSRPTDEPEQL